MHTRDLHVCETFSQSNTIYGDELGILGAEDVLIMVEIYLQRVKLRFCITVQHYLGYGCPTCTCILKELPHHTPYWSQKGMGPNMITQCVDTVYFLGHWVLTVEAEYQHPLNDRH